MTEEEARMWVRGRFGVSRETTLAQFGTILSTATQSQNLIAASTIPVIWSRHLTDSAQLIDLVGDAAEGDWLDVGSGAGLPGLVVAILSDRPVILVEPRGKRAAFLSEVGQILGLSNVTVCQSKVEALQSRKPVVVVSARAVAELSSLFASTHHCTDSSTVWVLPKGRGAQSEVDAARSKWQGAFHVEQSITQPESGIVVARRIRPK
jgi:16S rRNA (guanine527-N7)-methyltransferase